MLGRKTGGRKKGTPNKKRGPVSDIGKALKAERSEKPPAAVAVPSAPARDEPYEKEPGLRMLQHAMDFADDPSNPPGFRLEAVKVALPYVLSSAPDQQPGT